jgi:CubicO group peptidase (beta-lactamase class C family)
MDATTETDPRAVGVCPERLSRIGPWMDRLVAEGRLAGLSVTMQRRGQTVYARACGQADLARGTPFTLETVTRIYSMTKPLTSVAVMQLYERGLFQLEDPVSKFLPEFAEMRVAVGGNRAKLETEPARRPITIRDLLTHTAGLTYGFMEATLVDAQYRERGIDFLAREGTLAEMTARVAALPLLAQPGSAWNYSVATDVLGHLVAVVSGRPFADYLREEVIAPLGMVDTDFHVRPELMPRFCAAYVYDKERHLRRFDDSVETAYAEPPAIASGGGGLVAVDGRCGGRAVGGRGDRIGGGGRPGHRCLLGCRRKGTGGRVGGHPHRP